MSVKDIKKAIEQWQEASYSTVGRNPENISSEIDELEKMYGDLIQGGEGREQILDSIVTKQILFMPDGEVQRDLMVKASLEGWQALSSSVPKDLLSDSIKQLFKKFRTTKYQDPIILGSIARDWEEVINVASQLWPDKLDKTRSDVILATVPIPLLNGMAAVDKDGRYGVLLQEGLRFWPSLLSHYMVSILANETSSNVVFDFDKNAIRSKTLSMGAITTEFIGAFYKFAVEPGMVMLKDNFLSETSHDLRRVMLAIEAGFKFFILSHELAHCINKHCEQVSNTSEVGYQVRNIDFVLEKLAKVDLQLPKPTKNNLFNFGHRQLLEHIADRDALLMLMKASTIMFEKDNILSSFYMMGGLSFFWYIEISERVNRTILKGDSWATQEVYNLDFDIQNLLFRRSHPSPLSRFPSAIQFLISSLLEQQDIEQVSQLVDHYPEQISQISQLAHYYQVLESMFEALWEDNFPILLHICNSPDKAKPLHGKWSDEIFVGVEAIGIDSPLSEIYG